MRAVPCRHWGDGEGLSTEQVRGRVGCIHVVCVSCPQRPPLVLTVRRFLWLATTGIAGYAAWYYSKNSVSPFDDLVAPSHEIQETTKDAFSSNDEYAPINNRVARSEYEEEETETYDHERSHSVASSAYSNYDQAHPGRPLSWAAEREPITGIGGHAPIAPAHGDVSMPEIPDDYSYRGGRR